jgi:CRP-like cAMP-binding protein
LEKRVGSGAEPLQNRLLAALPVSDIEMLKPSLRRVDLDARQVLEVPGQPIVDACFVERGLVSVVGTTRLDQRIEVGMVGHEGMTGLGIVLGDDRAANETVVQSAGSALCIGAEALRAAMMRSASLTALLLRYVHVFLLQGSQTALANGRGRLDERLARWLLMWQDRLGTDDLVITHEFMALLLGVRRQGVTETLHTLEGTGLIRSSRNLIKISDRDGLQRAANGFYGIPEAEYERAIGGLARTFA